jgi:hypothetical protein
LEMMVPGMTYWSRDHPKSQPSNCSSKRALLTKEVNAPSLRRTASPLCTKLLGNASLALLPVCTLRLDGGVSLTLRQGIRQLHANRRCHAPTDRDGADSGHERPMRKEEPHGRNRIVVVSLQYERVDSCFSRSTLENWEVF